MQLGQDVSVSVHGAIHISAWRMYAVSCVRYVTTSILCGFPGSDHSDRLQITAHGPSVSLDVLAAIHVQRCAIDVGSFFGAEKQHNARDLFGLAKTAQRDGAGDLFGAG